MRKRSPLKQAEITISDFTKKGNGLGVGKHLNDVEFKAEVPFTMPGDLVKALVSRKRGGVFNGRLEEVIKPSDKRTTPKCVHFGVCGGCRWQHLSYPDQLKYKEEIVKAHFAELLGTSVDFRPIVSSPSNWQYRNKMEFSFSSDSFKHQYLGLMMDSGRGKVVNLTECHLVNDWFVDALKATRQWWKESNLEAYHPTRNEGSLRTLIVREGLSSGDRLVMLTVSGRPEYALNKHHLQSFVAFLREVIEPINPNRQLSIFLRIQQIAKGMPTQFYEMLLYGPDHLRETLNIATHSDQPDSSLEFTVSPSAFFQPNTFQAERLYSLALQMAQIPDQAVVYDLYCGTGTLGICAAKFAKQVIGVELSPESSLDARENAKRNHLDNITIITAPVDKALKQIHEEKKIPLPDIVMIDPPRAGLDESALKEIIALNAAKILYISCNPATQALNVAEFVKNGYTLQSIQPVDQFPQTIHIENIVILCRH